MERDLLDLCFFVEKPSSFSVQKKKIGRIYLPLGHSEQDQSSGGAWGAGFNSRPGFFNRAPPGSRSVRLICAERRDYAEG